MQISRTLHQILISKLENYTGRPLLLSGAYRTGKSTLLKELGKAFDQMVVFDMETQHDQQLFNRGEGFEQILNAILSTGSKDNLQSGTLVFFREIQYCPAAIAWIKRVYSDNLTIRIVASVSWFTDEILIWLEDPAGGPERIHLSPVSFYEFLQSCDDQDALSSFLEVPVPLYAYKKLLNYFHIYSLIGGMPEILTRYLETKDRKISGILYEEILDSMVKNLHFCASREKTGELTAETLLNSFPYAATRIKFNHFGNSVKKSREIAVAFKTLERHFFINLVYPTSSLSAGLTINHERSPRLQHLDTGLVNYFSGIQKSISSSQDMNSLFQGQVAKQVVGQELAATSSQQSIHYWVRKKLQSTAEVDFLIPFQDLIIPVVVKSGEPGRLRSIHQFLDEAPHPYAVRLSADRLSVIQAQTIRGKKFFLLNLPYFLASKIADHLQGFIRLASGQ